MIELIYFDTKFGFGQTNMIICATMVTKQSTPQHGEDLESESNGPGICDCGGPCELDADSTVPTCMGAASQGLGVTQKLTETQPAKIKHVHANNAHALIATAKVRLRMSNMDS